MNSPATAPLPALRATLSPLKSGARDSGGGNLRGSPHGLEPQGKRPGRTIGLPGPSRYLATVRLGKRRAGRLLDGVEHNRFPETSHA